MENYSEEELLKLYHDVYITEAIKIASPDLKTALDNWSNNPTSLSDDKKKSLEISFLKYLARISSRCTPFGLFAGCDVGTVADETKIVLSNKESFTRVTQFDMHFWIAMLQDFAKRKEVIEHLIYYPNNSIYSQGEFFRYVEYKYVAKKREHSISAIKKTELLNDLLQKAESGITVAKMISFLADEESEKEAALDYIQRLIDFQFLVSELDAQVTGNNEWERIFTILDKIPSLKNEQNLLVKCKEYIDLLDKTVVPNEDIYLEIKKLLNELGCDYEDKFLFQTDLNCTTTSNFLDKKIVEKTKQALYFLNGIQKHQTVNNLTNFITSFSQRYETREMPLKTVLDTDTGIGYIQNSDMKDTHPLLESFSFKKSNSDAVAENWTPNDFVLEKKLQEAITNNAIEIILTEKDFHKFNSDLENCPATFSVMIEVLKKQDAEQVVIESTGGISASKLLGRFCSVNQEIHQLTKEVIQKEEAYFEGKILAEIVHIPEARTGNILRRPILRSFEIPYLANSEVPTAFQIPVSDLMVSIKNNTIVLRSKRLNKEVIPCMSNAHNYSYNGLPIYHFLCDLQYQNLKPIYGFNWGVLLSHYNFFPRVVYKGTILSKTKWLVTNAEIVHLQELQGNVLIEKFGLWKMARKLSRFVNLVQSDNTLLLDFDAEQGMELFFKSAKNYNKIILEEFLFDYNTIVENSQGEHYTNQIILSFFKQK
ncbi:MAG: lantibiotic dehydratase family protein [Flavobacterium sp.]